MTAEVDTELGLLPFRFLAVTAKVYVAPVTRPVTTQLVLVVTHVPGAASVMEPLRTEKLRDCRDTPEDAIT